MTREEAIIAIHNAYQYGYAENIIAALKAEPCEDAVSRAEILQKYEKYCDANCPYTKKQRGFMCSSCMMGDAIEIVEDAPSVTPARKKGEWIKKTETIYYCNQCGRAVFKDIMEDMQIDYPYCHCGAEMETSECRW